MKFVKLCAVLPALLLWSGCGILSKPFYREAADYDLIIPQNSRIAPVLPVRFGIFSNLSGSGTRMLRRDQSGKILVDEYNRWLLLPEQLCRRGLMELFQASSDRAADVLIHCQILRFEIEGKKAVLEMEYQLRSSKQQEKQLFWRFETPMKEDDGAAAAAAMSENLLKSARQLNQEIAAMAKTGAKK